jgi:hypothetical protein
MPIWSDSLLTQLTEDAAKAVNLTVPFAYHRFYLATTAGVSVYNLPEKVKSITRITWRGKKLEPLSWEEAMILYPGLVYADSSHKEEGSSSVPYHYVQHPTNRRHIRILPTPNESLLDTGGDPYAPLPNEAFCTVTCWRYWDETEAPLPDYIDQRIRKAYALWKAFQKEGVGQDMKASSYYESKYEFLLEQFKRINSSVFVSKKYSLASQNFMGRRPPKPVLPPNFERVIY